MAIISLLRSSNPTKPGTILRAVAIALRPPSPTSMKGSMSIGAVAIRDFGTSSIRCSHHDNPFVITPSRWTWNKYKNDLHFYIMLGAIPLLILVFCVNVFIGPATLTPIPEGYNPKHWEYYKHPISRFFARYVFSNPQEDYERNLFYIAESEEKKRMRFLQWRVEELMAYRGDYPNYYTHQTFAGKYLRKAITEFGYMVDIKGYDNSIDTPRFGKDDR